jgi:predicted kinase
MKDKVVPNKPFLMLLYGYPGSGKTAFARQFAEEMPIVHLQADRFMHELHEVTKGQGNSLSSTLLHYLTNEFLRSGVSVVLDAAVTKKSERRLFRDQAKKNGAETVLVWLQIDPESAYGRTQKRDRRKNEDKYATEYSSSDFQNIINESQNPENEDYVVISGKHTFHTQRGTVMKKLFELGILTQEDANSKVVKPGLVNLIPQASIGRNNLSHRNISIRN